MNDGSMPSAEEFSAAFQTEMGVEPPAAVATPPAPTPSSDDGGDGTPQPPAAVPGDEQPVPSPEGDTPKVDEPADPQDGDGQSSKEETPEEKANREAEEAAKNEPPKLLTADDLKNAIKSVNEESTARIDQVHTAREEIINKVYPEGIDKNIYDNQGNVIKTAQDIVDRGLLNERTGEPFTYEEAASFMLEAGKKMAENIDELEKWAQDIAEKNISLMDSNKRVMEKWGETLKTLSKEQVERLANTYIQKQLKFGPDNEYVTDVSMTPEEFYDIALSPYAELAAARARAAELEEAAKAQAEVQQQAERNGLPPQRGQSDVKSNTGDPMLDALMDELKKG